MVRVLFAVAVCWVGVYGQGYQQQRSGYGTQPNNFGPPFVGPNSFNQYAGNNLGGGPQAYTCIPFAFPFNIQGGVAPQRPDDCNPATIEQEIKEIRRKTLPHIINGNLDAVMSIFAPDAYQMSSGAPTARGWEEVKQQTAAIMPSLKNGNVVFNRERYQCFGDVAAEIGPYTFYNAQGTVIASGREFALWKKINHVGEWKEFYTVLVGDV